MCSQTREGTAYKKCNGDIFHAGWGCEPQHSTVGAWPETLRRSPDPNRHGDVGSHYTLVRVDTDDPWRRALERDAEREASTSARVSYEESVFEVLLSQAYRIGRDLEG